MKLVKVLIATSISCGFLLTLATAKPEYAKKEGKSCTLDHMPGVPGYSRTSSLQMTRRAGNRGRTSPGEARRLGEVMSGIAAQRCWIASRGVLRITTAPVSGP